RRHRRWRDLGYRGAVPKARSQTPAARAGGARAVLRNRLARRAPRSGATLAARVGPAPGVRVIVSRAPFRFSLGGGGTDLPAYYQQHGGFVVSAAIDSYMYVTANQRFYPSIRLAYSETEIADDVSQIRHPIFREALRMAGISS